MPRQGTVQISVTGKVGGWFGVGFDAESMAETPYSILVDDEGGVHEYRLGVHALGKRLEPSVSVVSNVVLDQQRTVTVTRQLEGATAEHFTFTANAGQLKFISAAGEETAPLQVDPEGGGAVQFSHHSSKSANVLHMLPAGVPASLCNAVGLSKTSQAGGGSINGKRVQSNCDDFTRFGNLPLSKGVKLPTLFDEHNAACSVRTYRGGVDCCGNGVVMLDANQAKEIPKVPSNFQFKFRFYYEEYSTQLNAFFLDGDALGAEFDVPYCPPNGDRSPAECAAVGVVDGVHRAVWTFMVEEMLGVGLTGASSPVGRITNTDDPNYKNSDVFLVRAHAHCHAPSCIGATLFVDDTDEVLCTTVAVYENNRTNGNSYLLGVPPCIFGKAEDGLLPPPRLTLKTKLRTVFLHNASNQYQIATMADWDCRGGSGLRHCTALRCTYTPRCL